MDDQVTLSNNGGSNNKEVPVVLPCSIDAFRDFVTGLLGHPQEIEGGRFGSFSIGREEIEQTYHLVTQRVFQQNGVYPIGFTVRIVYDDGTSIQLNSFKDLQNFHEPKPVTSTECHIAFAYLIQFPVVNAPEKQDISISFVSSALSKNNRLPLATFASSSRELFARSYINYRIKYTARTWGADIEGLLKNHIEHLIEPEPTIRGFMRRRSVAIGLAMGVITFGMVFYGQSLLTERAIVEQLHGLESLFGKNASIEAKLDTIIQMLVSGTATKLSELSSRFIAIGGLISVILAIYVEDKADKRKPSFVLFTKRAEEEKKILLSKYEKSWLRLWLSIAGGIIIGISSNFIYDHYAKEAIANVMKNPSLSKDVRAGHS